MPSDLSTRWKKAKTDFQKITGEKKPKAKGFIASTLGHSGIDGAFKDADKHIDAIDDEKKDMKKKAKLIAAGEKHAVKLDKIAQDYIKFAKGKIKDEEADKNQRTTYTKALDFLTERLDNLDKRYDQQLDGFKIAMDSSLSVQQKATKMIYKSLTTTCANASAGIKKIKANPTPDQFNEIFNTSDNVARKVQVQLVQAANAEKKGNLPPLIVDPRFIADKLTPWQAGGKANAIADANWTQKQVLDQTDDFEKLLKLAARYLVDLKEKAPR